MRITIKLRKPDGTWDKYVGELAEYADVKIICDSDEYRSDDCEVLITTNLSAELLDNMPNLRRIYLFKTGLDKLPLDEIKKRGIEVFPSHANADVIAEHALTLALTLLHKTVQFHNELSHGIWTKGESGKWVALSELKCGILGYGAIGKSLCNKISALCSDVMVLNRSGIYPAKPDHAESFEQLVELNDMIFICVPKTVDTQGMFNGAVLNEMKGKYIVNISRAEICDERSLYGALKNGVLKGYASDVWFREPNKAIDEKNVMPSEYPFEELTNVVMSPHCATHETYSHERYIKDACDACIKYIKGEEN